MANSSENVEVKVVFKTNTGELDKAKRALENLGRSNSNNGANNTADSLNGAGDAADKLSGKFKNAGDAADSLSGKLKNTGLAASELGNRLLTAADSTDTLQNAFVSASAAANEFQEGMQDSATAVNGLVDIIDDAREGAEGFKDSFTDFDNALGTIKGFSGTLKGISGGLLAMGSDAITVAGEFEQMQAKLVTIQKSGQKASETFENAKKLAASTPFDVKGVVNAAVQLEVYGQNSKELLPVVANLASAMGGDVSQAATAMGRALSGSSEGLQSLRDVFGVTTDKLVKFGAALNKQGGIAVDSKENLEKLKKALTGLINTEFAGGIERQAATVAGAMANVEDSVTNLKAAIGSQFAPYMVVISRNLADIIEKSEQFAPTIALFGAVGAAATGMAGTFISAAVAAVGLQAATSKLGLSLGGLVGKMRGVQVAGVSMFAAGGWALGITALIAGAEALNVHLLAQIENEKKLQEGIAEEARQTVQLRHEWDNLRKAVEEATGAKVKFNEKDLTPGAVSIKEALGSTDVPGLQLYDKLSKSGYTPETIDAKIAQNNELINNQRKQIEDALKQYNAYTDAVEVYRQRGYTQSGTEALKSLGITEEELEASKRDVEVRKRRIEQLKEQASDLQAVKDRMSEIADPINKNIKEAQALGEYLKFADATKDIDVLKNALSDVGSTLQNLRASAADKTLVDVSDNKAIAKRMQELLKAGMQDGTEFKALETIFQMANVYEERQKKIAELQQQDLQKQIEAMDQAYAEQQAGRDRDLEAEREHVAAKLKLAEEERRQRLDEVAKEIRSGKLTQDQLKTQIEYREKLSHATKTEIEYKNQLHELDTKIAADANKKASESALQSLDSQIGTLKASADELASSATANSSDIIKAYDIILQKVEEWKKANAEIISQNSKVKSATESIIKGATSGRKMAVSRQNSELLTSLSEKASDRMVGVSGPLRHLDAVQANLSMYQQALAKLNRETNNLKETESTRVQLQKTINSLKRQELSVTEQIHKMEEQASSETKSIEIQLEQEKLATLEERAAQGEQLQQQIRDQQQKIYNLELQQLHDAEQKKLEEVKGSEKARLEVLKQYQMKREILEQQYNRKLNKSGDRKSIAQKAKEPAVDASGTMSRSTYQYQPGSPLMSMQEALSKHNQEYANGVNALFGESSPLGKSLSGTTPKIDGLGTAAASTGDKLKAFGDSLTSVGRNIQGSAASKGAYAGRSTARNQAMVNTPAQYGARSGIGAGKPAAGARTAGGYKQIKAWWEWELQQPMDENRQKKAEAYQKRQEDRDKKREEQAEAYRKRQEAKDKERERQQATWDAQQDAIKLKRQKEQLEREAKAPELKARYDRMDEERKAQTEQYRQELEAWKAKEAVRKTSQSGSQQSANATGDSKAKALDNSFSNANDTIKQTDQALDDMTGKAASNTAALQSNAEAAVSSAGALGQVTPRVLEFAAALTSAVSKAQNTTQGGGGKTAGGLAGGASDSGDIASGSDGDSFNSVLPSAGSVSAFPSANAAGVADMLDSSGSQLAQISNSSNFRNSTVNNYYVDSARLSESVDARAMAKMISKVTGQEARRIRTYTGR